MSGRSGYANGYGYSDTSRYDRGDGGYGNNSNLGVNGYGAGGGRERRPGGYGGFYPEASQQPALSPAASPERRRDRDDRDDRSYSSSRSRTRGPDPERERRAQNTGDGSGRSRREPSRPGNTHNQGAERRAPTGGRAQAVEGMCWTRFSFLLFSLSAPRFLTYSNTYTLFVQMFYILSSMSGISWRQTTVYRSRLLCN